MERQKPRDALGELAAVARAERAPELDLARLEARLVAKFETARARGELSPKARSEAARRAGPWLAAAALLILGLGLAREWTSLTHDSASTEPGSPAASDLAASGSIDGDSLALGTSVTAGPERGVRVEHDRGARWELTAGSGAHLSDAGEGVLCVELERGALSAVVAPSRAESFIVRARGTEVAVHGTRFEVALLDDRVLVSVSEGEVEVRPASVSQRAGALEGTTRARLTAGMRGAFVAGVPEAKPSAAPALSAPAPENQSEPSVTGSASPPRGVSGAAVPARKAALPRRNESTARSAGAPELATSGAQGGDVSGEVGDQAIARVTEHIQSCFRRHTSGRGAVSIEAATHVSLEVQSNGVILAVNLDPPLAPQVEACVASELANVNLGASASGYRVRREIRLSR